MSAMKQSIELLSRRLARWSLWRRAVVWFAGFVLLAAAGGFTFVVAGFAPVSASAGHWPVTDWLLHFAMRRAVQTRALAVPTTDIPDAAAVLQGAGHYASGCAPCHGAPGQLPSVISRQMTPQPPYLPDRIKQWESRELFWIVRHGIKFTAMPAWPALEREDEVWAMVAFLEQLPELTPAGYRELAFGPQADTPGAGEHSRVQRLEGSLQAAIDDCSRCHGPNGDGRERGAFPVLAGQKPDYLRASLRAYADGDRYSGVMQPVAAGLSPEAQRALAQHYSEMSAAPGTAESAAAAAIEAGRRIAQSGLPEAGVPSCTDCHGPGQGPRNPYYPELSGQYPAYLVTQLRLFKEGQRGGTPYAHIMEAAAVRLSEEQMEQVAAYYASLR